MNLVSFLIFVKSVFNFAFEETTDSLLLCNKYDYSVSPAYTISTITSHRLLILSF